jgi:hypothetical protein
MELVLFFGIEFFYYRSFYFSFLKYHERNNNHEMVSIS